MKLSNNSMSSSVMFAYTNLIMFCLTDFVE